MVIDTHNYKVVVMLIVKLKKDCTILVIYTAGPDSFIDAVLDRLNMKSWQCRVFG